MLNFPKLQKRTWFCQRCPNMPILPIWTKSSPFLSIWKTKHHGQTGNTTAKFYISLRRGRIVGQFLHWNFEVKKSQFFTLDRQKSANWFVWPLITKSSHFLPFWEIKYHGQTGNTTAKFCISLRRGRIAGQFLHWNFEDKNSQFFEIDPRKLAKSAFWAADYKIQSFLYRLRNDALQTNQ